MENEILVEDSVEHRNTAGAQLRAAREAANLDLNHIAAETRIPQRHLVAIEAGEYEKLPSRTYAIGFARTYARFVGLDEQAIIDQVRADLADGSSRAAAPSGLEPGDPARVPSRGLAWFAVLAAIILGAGIFAFYRTYFAPGIGPAPLTEATPAATPRPAPTSAAAVTPPATGGPVVFTSEMDGSWIRFYDATGEYLFDGIMDRGDSFTVPEGANGPQVRTGRPYAFAITIGGRPVAKLSEKDQMVKDVAVTAEALLARPVPAPAGGAAAAPAGTAAANPTGVATTPAAPRTAAPAPAASGTAPR